MSRGLTSTYVSSSIPVIYPALGAYMDFEGGIVRMWTGITDKTLTDEFGGGNYVGAGGFCGISAITETTEVASKGMELTLNGIPTEMRALALNNNYRGRQVAVYLYLFTADYSTYERVTFFKGKMNQLIIDDGPENSVVKLKCESRLITLMTPQDIRYTNESQKAMYPDDNGMKFVASMADKSIYWGNAAPSSPVATGGGSNAGGGDGSNYGSNGASSYRR